METKLLTGHVSQLDKSTKSAINKQICSKDIYCYFSGLENDEQHDKNYHGGTERAIHYYPSQHYQYWKSYWIAMNLPPPPTPFTIGAFGENLSDTTYDENNCHIGDIFTLGDAILQISQPRSPCYKLNIQFAYPFISVLMQTNGKTGWLMRVLEEGRIKVNDNLRRVKQSNFKVSVKYCTDILYNQHYNKTDLQLLSNHPELSPSWRKHAKRWIKNNRPDDWSKRLLG